MKLKHAIATAGLAVGITGSLASPAFAEGHFASYIDNWQVGHESRTWKDVDSDAWKTHVRFRNCYGPGNVGRDAGVSVSRVIDFWPDKKLSTKALDCDNGKTYDVYWGDEVAGTYYFTLETIVSGSQLWVDGVDVWW